MLSTVSSLAHVFNLQGILTLAVLIGLFVYTGKLNKDTMFASKEPETTVEKTHAQTKKQTSIYDQQLNDGILTQEEYDQIMENLK